jgi:hypothetical protein
MAFPPINVVTSPNSTALNLQGGNYNPQSGNLPISNPAIGSSMTPSATAPGTPKQAYINQQVQQPQTVQQQNQAYFNANPNVFGANQGSSQSPNPQQPQPAGTYNPYNAPSYQAAVQSTQAAQQSALNNQQIQSGLVSANTGLQGLQSVYSNNIQADLNNPNLSEGALTGQSAAEAQVLANKSVPFQTQINLLNQQQQQATAAAQTGLTAANTNAGFQAGLETPTPISPGQQLTQLNPSTGQASVIANQPSYSFGTNTAGTPISQNQTTGAIAPGGTQGLGATPPVLGSSSGQSVGGYSPSQISSAVGSTLQSLGSGTDPTTTAFYTNAAQQALANGGNVDPSLNAQQASVVKQILSSISGGQYSSTGSAINLANQTAQSQTAQQIVPIAKTALTNLNALQKLSDTVGYSNSPIANDIANQFSNTILTDPNKNTLQSALQFVTGEVSQVLGGGSSSLAALNDAQTALNAGSISPATLKSVIANATIMVNNRLTELQSPQNTVTVPNGLAMPTGAGANSIYNSSTGQQQIPAGSLAL